MVLAAFVEATLGRVAALGEERGKVLSAFARLGGLGAINERTKTITDGVDFRPTTDTSCFLTASRASDTATAVMFVFLSGCVLGAVPQYVKVVALRSSEGLSLTSLALMNVSNVCATMNVFVLHYEQIKRCANGMDGYGYGDCQASLVTLYYTLAYTLLWVPLYPLAAYYTSAAKVEYFGRVMTKRRAAWIGMVMHAVPCLLLAAPIVRMLLGSTCYEFENYAVFLGLLNALLETTRYVPQLWESLNAQASGAMSYMRLLLSVGGGLGATIQKAAMNESWSTWGPPLVGHGLEMAIFCVNVFNDMTNRRACGAVRDMDNVEETDELVADDEKRDAADEKKPPDSSAWKMVAHYL